MKHLPIGIQNFKNLRQLNNLYIDKTKYIYDLLPSKVLFLSRPRRFGKSLLLSTIKYIFLGEKELFKGLWIENNYNWKNTNPIIHIDMKKLGYRDLGLHTSILKELDKIARENNIELKERESIARKFEELIETMGKENPVVVLIDEYDKPIIDYLTDIKQAIENRETLKEFYGVLKGIDQYLRFLLITGVSKFSKTSIFSDLNHLDDISLSNRFPIVTGITENEIKENFKPYIEKAKQELNLNNQEFFDKLKLFYDGYSWNGKDFLYNPFSILRFFNEFSFNNFWFETGTPSFIINWIKKNKIDVINFENIAVKDMFFNKFDIENLDIISLMFQTGYLTIKKYNPKRNQYILSYPNEEVKESFIYYLFEEYSNLKQSQTADTIWQLEDALIDNNIALFIKVLTTVFTSIPYQIFIKEKESYYHSIIYIVMRLLGFNIKAEESISKGRSDAIVFTDSHIYIFEFKMFPFTAKKAIEQIKTKGYDQPYLTDKRKKVLVGISFKAEEKNIFEYEVEEI